MDNKKSTILIVSYDDNNVKSININSHFIKHFKKYLRGILLLFTFILFGIIILFYHIHNLNSSNSSLANKIITITNQVDLIDSLKLKEKIIQINNNLLLINNYLQTRGVLNNNEGGEASDKGVSDLSKIPYFEEESKLFLKRIQDVPLGIPYNGNISSGYGYRFNPFGGYSGEFHPGIDFKGQIGDSVYATGDGIIQRCDWYGGYGNAVVINHGNGLTTIFGHLSKVNVEAGQKVKAGDLIGFLGTTGRSTGPHVHYEIRKNGTDIDPNPFLKLK
jgi:murein DD-endopeptidase MepM/ murein hydrolase activator NlpD